MCVCVHVRKKWRENVCVCVQLIFGIDYVCTSCPQRQMEQVPFVYWIINDYFKHAACFCVRNLGCVWLHSLSRWHERSAGLAYETYRDWNFVNRHICQWHDGSMSAVFAQARHGPQCPVFTCWKLRAHCTTLLGGNQTDWRKHAFFCYVLIYWNRFQ